jgi:hypothetical protein
MTPETEARLARIADIIPAADRRSAEAAARIKEVEGRLAESKLGGRYWVRTPIGDVGFARLAERHRIVFRAPPCGPDDLPEAKAWDNGSRIQKVMIARHLDALLDEIIVELGWVVAAADGEFTQMYGRTTCQTTPSPRPAAS